MVELLRRLFVFGVTRSEAYVERLAQAG
jgi:hypothetical protein